MMLDPYGKFVTEFPIEFTRSNLSGLCSTLPVPAYGLTTISRSVTWSLQARDFSVIHVEITTPWDMCNR